MSHWCYDRLTAAGMMWYVTHQQMQGGAHAQPVPLSEWQEQQVELAQLREDLAVLQDQHAALCREYNRTLL